MPIQTSQLKNHINHVRSNTYVETITSNPQQLNTRATQASDIRDIKIMMKGLMKQLNTM